MSWKSPKQVELERELDAMQHALLVNSAAELYHTVLEQHGTEQAALELDEMSSKLIGITNPQGFASAVINYYNRIRSD